MNQIRPSTTEDIPFIMGMIAQAQNYFKQQGVDQWQDGYPNTEVIRNDIRNHNSYVLLQEDRIIATAMISFDGEPTYADIDGHWLTDHPYAVVHRIAVESALKGQNIAGSILAFAEKMCHERQIPCLRIDTHEENHSMQRVAAKSGFQYCGIIKVRDGAPRKAYEKVL